LNDPIVIISREIYNNPLFHLYDVVPRVSLLKPGSILKDQSGKILDARSSVSLIYAGTRRIVVDTGLVSDEKLILESLAQKGLEAEDIDIVINTHSHADHTGNNHIFSRAELISAKEETIAPGIRIIETPGHSMDSISVVVESGKVIVLAGDALPTFNNYLKGIPPAIHIDKNLAVSSMSRILKLAEVVVPGHDRPFLVYEKIYTQL
jgi:N-acyl homoserine lactone hydrolase